MRKRKRVETVKKGFVLLISGISGSGKTTIAEMLTFYLKLRGIPTFHLDGDIIRKFFDNDLVYDERARLESGLRLCYGAYLLSETGTNVIITCIMGNKETREKMSTKIDWKEVFIDADIEDCIANDPKGLYAKNMKKDAPNLRGIDLSFDPPPNPDLVLKPYKETPIESLQKLVDFVFKELL